MQEQATQRDLDEPKALNAAQKLLDGAASSYATRIGRNKKDYSENEKSLDYAKGAIEALTEQLGRTQSDSKKLKLEAGIRRWKLVVQKLNETVGQSS